LSIETPTRLELPRGPRSSTTAFVVKLGMFGLGLALVIVASVVFVNLWRSLQTHPLQVPAYLEHAPTANATGHALAALDRATTPENCTIVQRDPNRTLPTPYRRCAWVPGNGPSEVDYDLNWNAGFNGPPPYGEGLSFRAGGLEPREPDSCIKHLGGSWWAYMEPNPPQYVCPPSFQFQGAP
jgi:hypothetical protein